MRPRLAGPVAGAVLLVVVAPGAGTTGNLYEYGSSLTWATGSQFSASAANEVWAIGAPALNPAVAGSKWEMNWGCPVAGSVIAQVKWSALRSAGASHLEVDVLADGTRVWSIPDAWMPQSPAGGRAYDIGLAGGSCNVHLRLFQARSVFQNARTYFIDHPRVVVRDLTAPTVAIAAVQGGWINAGKSHSEIRWTTTDNFASDGVAEQRVSIGGQLHYRGAPGVGTHVLNAGIAPVGDGVHQVLVEADGDGTAAGSAGGTISIDQTPPGASGLTATHTGAPGHGSFGVQPADATSGVAETEVQLNGAVDGSTDGAWTGVLSNPGGGEVSNAAVRTSVVADGVHAWRARVRDVAGNDGYVTGPAPIVVDTTPPELALTPPPPGYVRLVRLDFAQSDNLQSAVGLGTTEFHANHAGDGSASGQWALLASSNAGPGGHALDLDLAGLSDGRHLLRARARNGGGLGESLFADQTVTVGVDNSSPSVTNVGFRPSGPDSVAVSWIAQDAHSGVARAVVQRRVGSRWQTLADKPTSSGAGRLSVDASGLDDGPVDLRLLVHDAAGNTSESRARRGTQIDGTAPSVTGLELSGGPRWRLTWSQSDAGGGLSQCATSIQVAGPGTQGSWREILARKLGGGRHVVRLPIGGLAPGAYRARVVACDPYGNSGSATIGGLLISDSADLAGAGGSADGPFARFRGAKLTLSVQGARVERRRGRRTFVARGLAGQRIVIRGRLRDRNSRPLRRTLLQARGHKNRVIGAARTRQNGTFTIRARPVVSGTVLVGVPAGRHLIPRNPGTVIRALVRPRVALRASSLRAARGQTVVFRGRMSPTPARIGGHARKSIVLEWLDPIRQRWRPVINSRARRDGRFSFRWRFGVSGLTIPMRVRVPVERGWPLQAGRSRVVRVTIG